MPPIGSHSTSTSTGAWDGPANEARLRADGSASYYASAHAWRDPDGDPETKAAWRFVHHEVSADGTVGAANLTACSTGIGVLNGGRGGTTIPSADRQGVYNHLAKHLRDGDREPPELNSAIPPELEELRQRALKDDQRMAATAPLEAELFADGDKIVMKGHSAVFDRLSEDRGGYKVRIQRGAFRKVLDSNPDVRLLFNHDESLVLARTTVKEGPGMLELREDPKGLRMYAELVPTSLAKDLQQLIRAGVVNQQSFSVTMDPETDIWTEEDDSLVRTVVSFKELFDVGPVTYPAFQQTDVAMYRVDGEPDTDALRDLAWKIHRQEVEATPEEKAALDQAFSHTKTVSPWMAERALRAACQEPELLAAIPGKRATVAIEDVPAGEPPYRLAARQRRLRMRERQR